MNTLTFNILIALLAIFLCYLALLIWNSGRVKVIKPERHVYDFLGDKVNHLFYIANLKYGISGDLSSAAAVSLNKTKYRPRREMMTGYDGGAFALDWFDPQDGSTLPQDAPIVMFAHGLSGGSNEPYLQKFALRCVNKLGYRAVCLIYRGCCGTLATTPQSYHGVFTEDLHISLTHINELFPDAPIALCGYSLGANLISQFLGERDTKYQNFPHYKHLRDNAPFPSNIVCAGAVGCPFDFLTICKYHPEKYQLIAGKGMMHWVNKNKEMVDKLHLFETLPKDFVPTARNIDEHFTCKFFHFANKEEFYDQTSCVHTMDGIKKPILFISAANDPFSMRMAFPYKELETGVGDNVGALMLPSGGHLGMFSTFSTRITFDEEILVKFFAYYFQKYLQETRK